MNTNIQQLIELLDKRYGKKIWRREGEPVGELIKTILSQNTTDKNSLKAYQNLLSKYKTWNNLLEAREEDIANEIRIGGLANIKAKNIKKALIEIKRHQGKLDLEFLANIDLKSAENYLLSLDGVGNKTAACVLIFSFNFPIIPVDTHIHRVSNRIGIVQTNSPEKTHLDLNNLIPPKNMYSFHINMIELGRELCKANNPQCQHCFINHICDYYKQ